MGVLPDDETELIAVMEKRHELGTLFDTPMGKFISRVINSAGRTLINPIDSTTTMGRNPTSTPTKMARREIKFSSH